MYQDTVDLGLPSGTLWCTHNVGAKNPEDYGDYFAWGETTPKKRYSLDIYKFFKWTDYIVKYTFKDGKTILDPEDDAAYVNMGGHWKMPTRKQIQELIDETNNKPIERNGINGMIFRSKINNNSIFIPAAGFYDDHYITSFQKACYLWASSKPADDYKADILICNIS